MACWAKIARRSRICSRICAVSKSRSCRFDQTSGTPGTSAPTWIAAKRSNETEIHLEQTPANALGAIRGVSNHSWGRQGALGNSPRFHRRKVLFGCGTFCVARTPIPMADPASAAKFVLGRSLACCSELNKSPLLMQIHISSQLRSPAAAAPPHVALAALQLQHGR